MARQSAKHHINTSGVEIPNLCLKEVQNRLLKVYNLQFVLNGSLWCQNSYLSKDKTHCFICTNKTEILDKISHMQCMHERRFSNVCTSIISIHHHDYVLSYLISLLYLLSILSLLSQLYLLTLLSYISNITSLVDLVVLLDLLVLLSLLSKSIKS